MDAPINAKDIWPFTALLLSISGIAVGLADLSNLVFELFMISSMIFIPGYLLIRLVERRVPLSDWGPSLLYMVVLGTLFASAFIIILSYLSIDSLGAQGVMINLITAIILLAMSLHQRYFHLRDSFRAFVHVARGTIGSIKTSSWREKVRLAGMALVVMLIIAAVYVWSTPSGDHPYTELYVLGNHGQAMDYKVNLTKGSMETFRVGISNHENARMTYFLQAWLVDLTLTADNATVDRMYFAGEITITLDDKELSGYEDWEPQWEYDMKLNVSHAGEFRLFFLLFKGWVPHEMRDPSYGVDYAGSASEIISHATQNKVQNVYLIVQIT